MSYLLVFTNATEGNDDEFNKWYDEIHLKEVLETPGFVAAQRFKLTEAQAADEEQKYRYLAIYEVEGDPAKAFEQLKGSTDRFQMTDTLGEAFTAHFTPIGERVTA